jgi:glycosyltransferase involved in cell wall biosynthesis
LALHYIVTSLLALVAFVWVVYAIDMAIGVPTMPRLCNFAPLQDEQCPSVSILFGARDEAEKLPDALQTFLALDYPRYEVIAVDDRSEDDTRNILESAAAQHPQLKVVHVDSLPAGWLGKPHALQQAFEHSSGEWLVFTDADVHFAPDLLRRTVALAESKGWGHLTLLAHVDMSTVGEKMVLTFFNLAFSMAVRPWRISNPKSSTYFGVGAFQLIRRSAYEKMGTHRRLAMEVVDDVKLGKLAKMAGIRSGAALSGDAVTVEWHSGVGNIIRGTTKNFYAAAGFRPWLACLQIFNTLLVFVFPFLALPFVRGWALVFAGIAAGLAMLAHAGAAIENDVSPLYGLTHPIGALILTWMLARSTIVTLRQGGIIWRGTFYPIEELKRGAV